MASAHTYLYTILLFSSVTTLLLAALPTVSGVDEDLPDWTIMVYMAADSEPALPWNEDVNEMEAADLADWMTVVVLVDPLGHGDSMLLEIARDDGMDLDIVSPQLEDNGTVIPSDGEVDMTSPHTLASFIAYSVENFPADRLALVLWGHSGGWMGLCQDGLSLLQLPDLGAALGTATDAIGRKVDVVIADCCFEGVLETMYELKDYADWYVGSEIAVPAQGLRYDLVLDRLAEDRGTSPADWAAAVCEVHRMTLTLNSWSATMVTCDLREMDRLAERLGDLASYMEGYSDLYRGALAQTLLESADTGFLAWYLDAGDALRRFADADLPLDIRFLALQTLIAYDDLIYDFERYASPFDDDYEDVLNLTGVAIYAPDQDSLDGGYTSISFYGSGWGDATAAIRADQQETESVAAPTILYADTDSDGMEDEATLRWSSSHDRLVAWVFMDTSEGLRFVDVVESSGSDLVLSGLAGELDVSASAWDGDRAVSHHTLDLLLTRSLEVRVTVVSGGEAVTDGVEVVLHTRLGPVQLYLSDEVYVATVTVPGHADYGDLLTVEVLGRDGEPIGANRTYVMAADVELEVAVTLEDDRTPGIQVLVPAAMFVAAAALIALYLRGRKSGLPP